MCKLVPNDDRWKYITTIDHGLGLLLPSLILSLYNFELGFHIGIEMNLGLHKISNMNIKALRDKDIKNIKQRYFQDDVVERVGELHCAFPPNATFMLGHIVSKFAEHEHLFILSHTHDPKLYVTTFIYQKYI